MNESKILDCKTISELEIIFDNLFKKTFEREKFLEQVKISEEKFYKMNSFLDQFFDINQQNSWDLKRREISQALNSHFAPIEQENTNFLGQLKKLKFSFDENFIEKYEELLHYEFRSLKRLYSKKAQETPGINYEEEYDDINNTKKFKVAICISEFRYFSDSLSNFFASYVPSAEEDVFYAYLVFSNEKLNHQNFQPSNNDSAIMIKGLLGGKFKYDIYHFDFAEAFPSFLNIFLYSKNGYFIGSYRYEIDNKEIYYCENLHSENQIKDNNYSLLEIKLVKGYSSKVDKKDLDLNRFLFRPPRYLYNYKIDNLVNETNYDENDIVKIKKYGEVYNKYYQEQINMISGTSHDALIYMHEKILSNILVLELKENLEKNYNYFKTPPAIPNQNLLKIFVGKFMGFNPLKSKNEAGVTASPTPLGNKTIDPSQLNYTEKVENEIFGLVNIQLNKILDILIDSGQTDQSRLHPRVKKETLDKINNFLTNRSVEPTANFEHVNHILGNEADYFSFRTMTKMKTNNLVDNTLEIKKILKDWINKNENSFEEILYSLVLIDTYSITIFEKLHLLYQIGKMRNYSLCNRDNLCLKKFKQMIYALYKRFMINFSKAEIDVMIDYLIKKEEYANIRFALCHSSGNREKINNIINENLYPIAYEDRVNKQGKIFEDVKIFIQSYFNLLKNNFLVEKLNMSYFNSIWDIFAPKLLKKLKIKPNETLSKWSFDSLKIDFSSDNIRKTTELSVVPINKETFKIEKIENNRIISFTKSQGERKLMEDLINNDLNSINLSNIDSDESNNVSFDLFKDVFFKLPFISEFLRSSSGFTEDSFDSLNRKLGTIYVNLSVGTNKRFFAFGDKMVIKIFLEFLYNYLNFYLYIMYEPIIY